MIGADKDARSDRVEVVRTQIQEWRQTRAKRGPMSEALWDAAVAVALLDGVYKTSRALPVEYTALKKRVERLADMSVEPVSTKAGFVELGPVPRDSAAEQVVAAAPGSATMPFEPTAIGMDEPAPVRNPVATSAEAQSADVMASLTSVVELISANGSKMTIRLGGGASLDEY